MLAAKMGLNPMMRPPMKVPNRESQIEEKEQTIIKEEKKTESAYDNILKGQTSTVIKKKKPKLKLLNFDNSESNNQSGISERESLVSIIQDSPKKNTMIKIEDEKIIEEKNEEKIPKEKKTNIFDDIPEITPKTKEKDNPSVSRATLKTSLFDFDDTDIPAPIKKNETKEKDNTAAKDKKIKFLFDD